MKTNYKLLIFIPLMFTCGDNMHQSVYGGKFVVRTVKNNKIFAKSIKDGTDKTFVTNTRICDHLTYVFPGDTIEYFNKERFSSSTNRIINVPNAGYLKFNSDSLEVRQNRRFYANTRYEKLMEQR